MNLGSRSIGPLTVATLDLSRRDASLSSIRLNCAPQQRTRHSRRLAQRAVMLAKRSIKTPHPPEFLDSLYDR